MFLYMLQKRAVLDVNGNFGIGTTAPGTLLHIDKANAGGIGPTLWIKNSAASTLNNRATLAFATNAGDSTRSGAKIEAINTNASILFHLSSALIFYSINDNISLIILFSN